MSNIDVGIFVCVCDIISLQTGMHDVRTYVYRHPFHMTFFAFLMTICPLSDPLFIGLDLHLVCCLLLSSFFPSDFFAIFYCRWLFSTFFSNIDAIFVAASVNEQILTSAYFVMTSISYRKVLPVLLLELFASDVELTSAHHVNMSPIQSCMNDLTLSFPKKILISIFGGFGLIGCFNCF